MKYNSDHYYRIACGIMMIVLIPFWFLTAEANQLKPGDMVIIAIIIGNEYSYIFPRQAMKLYEEILFQSFVERISGIIEISIFIIFSILESYNFSIGNFIPLIVFVIVYFVWLSVFQKQSVMIGEKNIIIGNKFISHDMVQSVAYEKNSILIKTNTQSFKISNWAINNQRWKLEQILKQITEEGIEEKFI
ncbi:hypothetical protein [Clostridium sp. ZS2-4]|uniref:hypothetical protein n=1 Tax=Clostridium sp. ZS2-4 TaxID=2987703 RepID=UPI00227D2E2C|nr:hypothetical protein [Clostridium sp. ZS2-4]MCY6354448.1 hypothetical protein [Clostridium sp. ZS2-4]